ncbi:vitamin B12 ABC transporter substrate-binding protein BtuF [Proteus myxofaciens]|uniref:Vitamin B12-binding protein n=1 Tax=Proteus myxofaciens ATCC 19692 TaxID=1354337 RepID=A0A198FJT2_9GAMM|nr:vitamin B12 ABC transporter substrate-binding protein BtuF [Proteus myxofaciens]OAT25192.1 substrate-binding component of an ABC superfamily vitamin B12 transporter [Proteus myxofaciens ATCC 19692]
MRLFIVVGTLLSSFILTISSFATTPAKRIITLSPSATEMAYAAGMGDYIVGVSAYSDYPENAQKKEQVANWQGINVERILLLKPDLIIAWPGGNPQRPLDQLKALGIPILYSDPHTIDDVANELDMLSKYSVHPEIALKNADQLRQKYQQIRRQYTSSSTEIRKKKAFIQFSLNPLFTTSHHSLQSDITEQCGGKNIFADSIVAWPQVSREQVLIRKPEIIIFSGKKDQIPEIQAFWQPQLNIPIIAIDEDSFSRPAPRIINAMQQICEALANQ